MAYGELDTLNQEIAAGNSVTSLKLTIGGLGVAGVLVTGGYAFSVAPVAVTSVAGVVSRNPEIQQTVEDVAQEFEAGTEITQAGEGELPQVGDSLTRNFGGAQGEGSDLYGHSWTTDPVETQSRNSLGLPTGNTAEFQAHGTVCDNTDFTTQEAEAIPSAGVNGGGAEVKVPDAKTQIIINAVTMPDDPLPFSLPTDPDPFTEWP